MTTCTLSQVSGFTDGQVKALRIARSRATFGLHCDGRVRTADGRCPLAVASGMDAWEFLGMQWRLGLTSQEVSSIVGAADYVSHPLRGELLQILGGSPC